MNLSRFAASIGIGAAQLHINLPSNVCPRASILRGTLEVEGGAVPQHVEWLSVALIEHWSANRSTNAEERDLRVLAGSLDVLPGSHHRFPFEFEMHESARLTSPSGTDGWRLNAVADILMAVNPSAMVELKVVIHREIRAVQVALERLGFRPTVFHVPALFPIEPEETIQYYRATSKLQGQLDGASLQLRVGDNWVMGKLVINRRETSLAEHLKSLVGGNNEEFSIALPRKDLLTPGGSPNSNGARATLQKILEDVIVLPGDLKKQLLRPASRPASEDGNLLRPVHSLPESRDGSGLLRPSECPSAEK